MNTEFDLQNLTRIRIDKIFNDDKMELNDGEFTSRLFKLIDYTTLEGTDNDQRIESLCMNALRFSEESDGRLKVAAVCVYPVFVALAKGILQGSGIKVASVAGAFPAGQSPLDIRLKEVEYALDQGADEIDMVITRGQALAGNLDYIFHEVSETKLVCGNKMLKVILETGELKSLNLVKEISRIAIEAGADFIKTSTGKTKPAAEEAPFVIMLDAINEKFQKDGKRVGIKPAGGIAEYQSALRYYRLVESILGEHWLSPDLFRIGASRLVENLQGIS